MDRVYRYDICLNHCWSSHLTGMECIPFIDDEVKIIGKILCIKVSSFNLLPTTFVNYCTIYREDLKK